MLQPGVLAPVHEATPWINSFVLVESKDKLGNFKLHICLDPTNLNKAITRESYHFRTPEYIAHLLADACVMTVCDCKRDIGIKSWIKLHLILQLSILRLEDSDMQ